MEDLTNKIELLEEQIENIERSGFFTEKEIDRASFSLRTELEYFKNQRDRFGMTQDSYDEGKKTHEEIFKPLFIIPTNKPEFLIPNQQEK